MMIVSARKPAGPMLIAIIIAVGLPATAGAQCTEASDACLVKKSIRQATHCNDKILRAGPGASCTLSAPPACAGTLATDAVALAYEANINPPTASVDRALLGNQLNCQKQLGKAVRHYVGIKLRALITGRPSDPLVVETKATKHLDKIAEKCAVTVGQEGSVILPAVGKVH